jgi:hypothetical protein
LDEVTAARKPILRWDPGRQRAAAAAAKEDGQPKAKKLATPVVPTAD